MAISMQVSCFVMNILARGVSETWVVFLLPVGAEFEWSRTQLAGVYSVFMVVHGLAAPLAGLMFDRFGPRVSYVAGLTALGSGYFLAGRLDALWQFYLCVGVLGGIGVAFRDRAFRGLVAVFFFTGASIYATTIQIVAYLVDIGFEPLHTATAFGFLGMLSTGGVTASGWMVDRYGRRWTATITYSMTLIGFGLLFLLAVWPGTVLLALFVASFGVSAGSRGPVVSTLAAELFPGGGLGAIYGVITLGMGVGAGMGSWISGMLYDVTSGYVACFAFGAVMAVFGLAQFWLVPALASGRRETA